VLELPDGTELPLETDVVVGRKPTAIDGAATLEVPDSTRTLSKSHARLTREGAIWMVEDLGSTNGLFLLNDDGSESELTANVPVEATERMLLGTLEVRLRPGGDAA
jgi:pSer/pThr/pTyr-binding forkhead associated (FHA) protein